MWGIGSFISGIGSTTTFFRIDGAAPHFLFIQLLQEPEAPKFYIQMKKAFITLAICCATAVLANAQDTELPAYNRSSLHLILLTTDEPTIGETSFNEDILKAWKEYPFPDKYDQIAIDYIEDYGGKPKGSMMELIDRYKDGFGDLSFDKLKELQNTLGNNKYYNQQLIDTTMMLLESNKVAQQLLRKWYNIKDDGSYDNSLLIEKSLYSATQSDVANATSTARGENIIIDNMSDDLIAHTFISFSKLAFYENEPVAMFSKKLAYGIAEFLPNPVAQETTRSSADVAYQTAKKGYSAYTTTVLYQLDWNDSTMTMFYSAFEGDKINMEKFNSMVFPFKFIGIETATSSTVDALGGLADMVGIEAGKPQSDLIQQTIIRNIDKVFAKMQYNYDVFKPLVPIISTEPLLADVGMKEGIDDKSVFDLLEVVVDPSTGEIEYKTIASLKVVKGKVWDNRYSLLNDENSNNGEVKGTELKKNKKAVKGMLLRQRTKK